ncbi:MAG: BamA/TamA family outer membrane protein [Longimicrobiales bacterium]
MARVTPFAILLGLSLQATALPDAPADSCPRGLIAAVVVNNPSIFTERDSTANRRLSWLSRAANAVHFKTRESVIRREILFAPGDCFDPLRVTESERLLRGFNGLSRVSITDSILPDSAHRLTVETHDEWSTRVDIRLSSRSVGARITEDNFFGTGQAIGVFYVESDVARDYGVSFFTPQLLGTRWNLQSDVGRSRAGTIVREAISYPWVGEVSHWASIQTFVRVDRFFDYIGADDPELHGPRYFLPLRDQSFDLAVVRRFGPTGNTTMLGFALGYQRLSYPGELQYAPTGNIDERVPADSASAAIVSAQHAVRNNIRAYALVGHRTVRWVRRRGMDSMHGQEDVRLGAEIGLGFGHSISSLERDNDVYSTLSMYTGTEVGDALVIAKFRGDGLRSLSGRIDEDEWQDLYAESEVLGYYRPGGTEHHLLFLRLAGISASRTETPFQLTLGGERGLRGYDIERFPGGKRAVFNLEDRMYFGWPKAFDLGATLFMDAGRIWSGDVPFGIDSGWRGSAGAGLRLSFPAGSRTIYRVDFAWPLERGVRPGDFRLQVSLGEPLGMNPRVPDVQLSRSRPQGAAGQFFPSSR